MTKRSTTHIQAMARRLGVAPSTIRYYERTGVVRRAPRSSGQFRIYGEAEERALRQVLSLRALGLSLREIRALQSTACRGSDDVAAEIRRAIQRHIDQNELQQRELAERRRWLERLRHCECPGECETLIEVHTRLGGDAVGRGTRTARTRRPPRG